MSQGEKREAIRYIQSLGLRIYVGYRSVTVWDAKDPELEWGYSSLQEAYKELKGWVIA